MTFESLGLPETLTRALADAGYDAPTSVQSAAIPPAIAGTDLMVAAATGSGKTASFMLPALQRVLAARADTTKRREKGTVYGPRVLVLTPTRELAIQIAKAAETYGRHVPGLRVATVVGGVPYGAQLKALRGPLDIMIATPGRLLDHVQNKTVMLGQVSVLTLDEADRMLDMGFMPDIKRILSVLPPRRQNLLFSATFPDEVRRLAKGLLHAPVTIEVAPRNAPPELVTHQVYLVPAARKRALLTHLIRSRNMRQVLIFVRMKRDANRLAREIQRDGIATQAIHSDRTQAERMQALDEFKEGKVTALVATDIAARGLDIEELPFVVNYELPHAPEDYVHRIGRTGRAGLPGEAISLAAPDEMKFLEDVERLLKRKMPRANATGFERDSGRGEPAPSRGHAPPKHHERPRPPARTHPHAREKHAPPSSGPVFDFTKPYEPSPSAAAPAAAPAPGAQRRHHRPTAALLGGSGAKHPHKKS
jgi:ATP-dependent RNA helicase RhlE